MKDGLRGGPTPSRQEWGVDVAHHLLTSGVRESGRVPIRRVWEKKGPEDLYVLMIVESSDARWDLREVGTRGKDLTVRTKTCG